MTVSEITQHHETLTSSMVVPEGIMNLPESARHGVLTGVASNVSVEQTVVDTYIRAGFDVQVRESEFDPGVLVADVNLPQPEDLPKLRGDKHFPPIEVLPMVDIEGTPYMGAYSRGRHAVAGGIEVKEDGREHCLYKHDLVSGHVETLIKSKDALDLLTNVAQATLELEVVDFSTVIGIGNILEAARLSGGDKDNRMAYIFDNFTGMLSEVSLEVPNNQIIQRGSIIAVLQNMINVLTITGKFEDTRAICAAAADTALSPSEVTAPMLLDTLVKQMREFTNTPEPLADPSRTDKIKKIFRNLGGRVLSHRP